MQALRSNGAEGDIVKPLHNGHAEVQISALLEVGKSNHTLLNRLQEWTDFLVSGKGSGWHMIFQS
jgi:hypothetical protein